MNFVKYLMFKYKLTRHSEKRSSAEVYAERAAFFIFPVISTAILYFIINLFSQHTQHNMNKYTFGLYAFVFIISLSSAIKKYYKEYFLSLEREILLIVPIKSSQIILSRFFVVALEVLIINVLFLIPFVMANYFAGNISLGIALITIPQAICVSIFSSSAAHIVFAIAYIISKGKGLKTVAYSLMTIASVGVIVIIVFLKNYKSLFLVQNNTIKDMFYIIFKYPEYLLVNHIDTMDVGIFTITLSANTMISLLLAYFLTSYCYKKGLLSVSSRDIKKSFYATKFSVFVNKHIKDFFLKKDVLYLSRSPKLFSAYLTPILFTSVIETKSHFVSSGILFPIFINVFTLFITTITLSILQSDDLENKDLLFSIPFRMERLFKSRRNLLYLLSSLIAGIYIVIICIAESVRWEYLIFGISQLLLITYISSKVMMARVIQKSNKDLCGYRYNGSLSSIIIYYFFIWNIPLLIFFSILYECLRQIIDHNYLSIHASFVLLIILAIVISMLYRSTRITIDKKEDKSWQI
ncbi:elicitor-associated permease-like protein [Bacillus sp. CGMCC 1.60114]|uniref:elicitor-associated permease-like protein n=1 Tax=unclassified Bacillus (in: firmicutes) TaxID=185979 RepID=UPI0036301A49